MKDKLLWDMDPEEIKEFLISCGYNPYSKEGRKFNKMVRPHLHKDDDIISVKSPVYNSRGDCGIKIYLGNPYWGEDKDNDLVYWVAEVFF